MCRQIQQCSCGHRQTAEVECVHAKFSVTNPSRRPARPCNSLLQDELRRTDPCDICANSVSQFLSSKKDQPRVSSGNPPAARTPDSPAPRSRGSGLVSVWIEDQRRNHPPDVGSNQAPEIKSRVRALNKPPAPTDTPKAPGITEIAPRRGRRKRHTDKSPRVPRSRSAEEMSRVQEKDFTNFEGPRPAPNPPMTSQSNTMGGPGPSYAHHPQAQRKTMAGIRAIRPHSMDVETGNRGTKQGGSNKRKSKDASPGFLGGIFSTSWSSRPHSALQTLGLSAPASGSFREGVKHLGSNIRSLAPFAKPPPSDDESFACVTALQQSRKAQGE